MRWLNTIKENIYTAEVAGRERKRIYEKQGWQRMTNSRMYDKREK